MMGHETRWFQDSAAAAAAAHRCSPRPPPGCLSWCCPGRWRPGPSTSSSPTRTCGSGRRSMSVPRPTGSRDIQRSPPSCTKTPTAQHDNTTARQQITSRHNKTTRHHNKTTKQQNDRQHPDTARQHHKTTRQHNKTGQQDSKIAQGTPIYYIHTVQYNIYYTI